MSNPDNKAYPRDQDEEEIYEGQYLLGGSPTKTSAKDGLPVGKIDEFALLMRIVRHERAEFLREIQYRQLFSIS